MADGGSQQKSWKYGSGSISLEPNGRYRARLWNKAKKKYDPVGTFDTLREAQRALVAEHAIGEPAVGMGLGEFGELCIQRFKRRGKDSWKTDLSRWKMLTTHGKNLAVLPPDQVSRKHIKEFLASLLDIESERGEPYGESSVKHLRDLLSAVYKEAVEDELVTSNVMADISAPKGKDCADNWTSLELAEIYQLARCNPRTRFADDNVHPLWRAEYEPLSYEQATVFLFVIYTGLRQGECAALTWSDVVNLDGEGPHLWITKSWHKPYTKTRKARRVDLIPAAVALLKEWRESLRGPRGALPEHVWGKRYSYGHDWGWAVKVELGDRQVCTLGAKQRAGIMRRVTFHHLRDTCASHLLTGTWGFKWTIAEVASLLGHTTTYVTERYARILPGALAEIAAQTFRQVSVGKPSSSPQLSEITGRAMQDSNLRLLAPEANSSAVVTSTCGPDGKSTETLAAEIARNAMALAMQALEQQHRQQSTPTVAPVVPLTARRKRAR